MDKPFDPVLDLHEHTEIHEGSYFPLNSRTGLVSVRNSGPRVREKLLNPEGETFVGRIDIEHDSLNGLALGKDFARILDSLGPRNIGNMNKTVDAVFDPDEGAEIGNILDLSLKFGPGRVALLEKQPRILFGLLETEGNPAVTRIDAEDDRFYG